MSTKGACLACRVRKVKCIPGPTQSCERCTKLGLEDCHYKQTKKRGIGKTLRMGEACTRCRARKRKCDAKQPCTTCVGANMTLECEYEIDVAHFRPSGHPRYEPGPSDSRVASAQERWAVGKVVPEPPTRTRAATVSGSDAAPLARAPVHSLGCNNLPPYTTTEPRSHPFDEVRTHNPSRITPPHFSVLPSLIFPRIPPEPYVTLLSLGAGQFQLSQAALGELDMKFRLMTVCRLNKLGIRFSSEKQRALLRGDTSGTVINPFFIPAAQSLGMHFCEGMDDSPAVVRLQAEYVQRVSEPLAGILKGHDPELQAQVALWVVAGSIIMRLSSITSLYIKRCCATINTAGLRFVPTYGRPPEFSEDLQERLAVLSQIIYFENFFFLTCGGAEPTMTARIEKEFRHQLQEVYPVLFNICPLTMRTQTILLVRDTVVVLHLRTTDEVQLGKWRQSCDKLMILLEGYSKTLLSNLRRFQELGDNGGAGMIRNSCVNCLAHLAVLCEALGEIEPTHGTEPDTLCDSTLERLGELAQDMRMEECTRLDLLLGLSWRKALGVFDARLAGVPPERSAKLLHWRGIVAKVHSDFEAKFPNPKLPTLIMQAVWGRTERPLYPNLMPLG